MASADRFDKLRRVRSKALDQAVAAVARIEHSWLEENRKLEYLRSVRADYAQRSPIALSGQFDIPGLQRSLHFNDRLDAAIAEQSRRCESVGAELARRRQTAAVCKRALQTLDKLTERQQQARITHEAVIEQKRSDEAAAVRFNKTEGEYS